LLLKGAILFDEALIVGLLSGGALTLTTAKGIYTAIRQKAKRDDLLKEIEPKTSQTIIIKNKGAQHD
jgi:hypothetical protein